MPKVPAAALLGAALALTALTACSSTAAKDGKEPVRTPPNPAAVVDGRVNPALFGMHVGNLATGAEPVPERAGGIRLWDAGVSWRQIEPAAGQVDWAAMDRAVEQAEAAGATEILWVHGSTPQWAALDPDADGLYGPGTSSAPDEDAYLDILRRVAERYKGRITAYQAWNEANIRIFYRGKPAYLAELTAKAKAVLDEVDPDALLVGASTTVRAKGPVKAWYGKYSTALAEQGWPVDAMSIHLYPLADEGPSERAGYIRTMKAWLEERGWTGPLWDTEVNFGDRRDFAEVQVEVPQDVAAGWVARTYLDSLALGVDRAYWYTWNDSILGIDLTDPATDAVLPAGQAYLTIQEWLAGAQWGGCTGELVDPTGAADGVTVCQLTGTDGTPAQVLYTLGKSASVPMPEGAREVCQLDGTCAAAEGAEMKVTGDPVLVRLGA